MDIGVRKMQSRRIADLHLDIGSLRHPVEQQSTRFGSATELDVSLDGRDHAAGKLVDF